MITLPSKDTKKWSVGSGSDLSGYISYTKNINLDIPGYVKLSSRSVLLASEETDSTIEIPFNFGRYAEGSFYITGGKNNNIANISQTNITSPVDVGAGYPAFDFRSGARWWQSRWYASKDSNLYYKTISTGAWSASVLSLTALLEHPIEVFKNLNTLVIGNGNVLYQIDTSHSATTNLTIPSDFEITNVCYNNNRVGISTRLSSTVRSQNQDAMFFVWDGSSAQANSGTPCGSDNIVSMCAYKDTWVILTRTGQLLKFNGTGFSLLSNFPVFFQNITWGDFTNKLTYGVSMITEGDVIYINLSCNLNQFGKKQEITLTEFPSGIWCYDPEVGVYHKYSPSISQASLITVATANVNTGTDILTVTTGTVPVTGSPTIYTLGDLTDIKTSSVYYIIKLSATTFKLATTYDNAISTTAIDITSAGSGTHYFHVFDIKDFGSTQASSGRVGSIGLMGVTKSFYDHLIFGGEYSTTSVSSVYGMVCYTVPLLENRGYFVIPKIESSGVTDVYKKSFIKFKKLKDADKIICKVKTEDIIGLPVTSYQVYNGSGTGTGNFTSTTTLTTTADISEAKTYFDLGKKLDLELTEGVGAGCISDISNITYSAGTYTITLSEVIIGASNGLKANFIIDNWKTIRTISATSVDNLNGIAEIPIGLSSKWSKLKIELRGSETTIEELQIINGSNQPSV